MKTDEKKLITQIRTEEEQKAYEQEIRLKKQQQIADSLAQLPKAMRLKEDRSVDQLNPPIVIDIEASRKMPITPIKVSDLFKSVEYTRIEQDPDSMLAQYSGRVICSDDYIYLHTMGSIMQYDRMGKFVQYVCKSKLYFSHHNQMTIVHMEGARSMPYIFNNTLYYKYEDQINDKLYFIAYDESKGSQPNLEQPDDIENIPKIRGNGEVIFDFNQTLKKPPYSTDIFFINKDIIAYTTTPKILECQDNIVNLRNSKGDTICAFPDYDKVTNYTRTVYRRQESGTKYYHKGVLHVRQAYNDTIYQVVPPNRLVPKYILNFGSQGLQSSLEAVDSHSDLSQKLILKEFLETNRYLFITYSKDIAAPYNKDKVKFSRVVFDKATHKIIPIYTDADAYAPGPRTWPSPPPVVIENDIDELPFFWPFNSTPQGDPMINYNGDDINKIKQGNLNKNAKIIGIYKN